MIANTAPIHALYVATDGTQYTLPVVAWTNDGQAAVPQANGSLTTASSLQGFQKLDRDVQIRTGTQTLAEEYGIE
jgi:hypothetical protein